MSDETRLTAKLAADRVARVLDTLSHHEAGNIVREVATSADLGAAVDAISAGDAEGIAKAVTDVASTALTAAGQPVAAALVQGATAMFVQWLEWATAEPLEGASIVGRAEL